MKKEPDDDTRPPSRFVGISEANPNTLIYSDMPNGDTDATMVGMAEEVGVTSDALIAELAVEGLDELPDEAGALSAKAGAIGFLSAWSAMFIAAATAWRALLQWLHLSGIFYEGGK